MNESEGLNMEQSRERFANEVDVALAQSARPFAIHNARKVDARGVVVPEKLRTLDRGRPWRDSQFASTRLSPSRDMSR